MKDKFNVSPRQAAQILRMRLDALYSLIWAGRLDAKKVDGRWLISDTAVQALAEKRNK